MSASHRSAPSERTLPVLAKYAMRFAQRYHQFVVHGDEHIPQVGPALLVSYHGLVPLDGFYIAMHHYQKTGRMIRGLTDRHYYPLPLFNWFFRTIGTIPGSPENAEALLRDGHLVGVYPGGVREAFAGESAKYRLHWDGRLGFARVALAAQVPIVPVFTENVDELYKAPGSDNEVVKNLVQRTHLPLTPVMGLGLVPFPVPLRTWIAPPIHPQAGESPELLAQRTRVALEALIEQHQRPGQTLLTAVRERFGWA